MVLARASGVEAGWDARTFLSECCEMKAHTFCDAWRDREAEVFLFTTHRFGGMFNSLQPCTPGHSGRHA